MCIDYITYTCVCIYIYIMCKRGTIVSRSKIECLEIANACMCSHECAMWNHTPSVSRHKSHRHNVITRKHWFNLV